MKNIKIISLLFLISLQSMAQAYTPVNPQRVLTGAFPFKILLMMPEVQHWVKQELQFHPMPIVL